MAPIRADLLRSESSSSLGSSSDEHVFGTSNATASSKRTRKRFTGSQLAMLEQLFHCASHPSREQRESLAQELDLYETLLPLFPSSRALTHRLTQGAKGRDDMVPESPAERAQGFHCRRLGFVLSVGPSDTVQVSLVHPPLAFIALCTSDTAREATDARDHGPAL